MSNRRPADPSYDRGNEIRFEERGFKWGGRGSSEMRVSAPMNSSTPGFAKQPGGNSYFLWFLGIVFALIVLSVVVAGIAQLV